MLTGPSAAAVRATGAAAIVVAGAAGGALNPSPGRATA
jgi:hypothetical protein